MKALFTVLSIAVLGSCRSPERQATGTYRISVCKVGPCIAGDSSHAVAVGVLVLLDSTLFPREIPASAGPLLTRWRIPGTENGCYDIKHTGVDNTSYAGGVGGTLWRLEGEQGKEITFNLISSPDAFYVVRAIINGDQIAGVGHSSGSGVTAVHWPRDTVVATKIGPADVSRCIAASIRDWQAIRQPPNTR